jgi:hypothetical protein
MKTPGQQIYEQLESQGEDAVRAGFLRGDYGSGDSPMHAQVREWLRSRESGRADRKADLSLSNSEKAVSLARQANRIAIAAIVLSTIIAIIQIFKL